MTVRPHKDVRPLSPTLTPPPTPPPPFEALTLGLHVPFCCSVHHHVSCPPIPETTGLQSVLLGGHSNQVLPACIVAGPIFNNFSISGKLSQSPSFWAEMSLGPFAWTCPGGLGDTESISISSETALTLMSFVLDLRCHPCAYVSTPGA